MEEIITEFYAVTITSLYHIVICPEKNIIRRGPVEDKETGEITFDYLDPEVVVVMEKIATKSENSSIAVGKSLSSKMLSIGQNLIPFIPKGGGISLFERRIENVDFNYWKGQTSPVVALFFEKYNAELCFNYSSDLKPCDIRWIEATKNVLHEIGEDHPRFSICHHEEMALIKD